MLYVDYTTQSTHNNNPHESLEMKERSRPFALEEEEEQSGGGQEEVVERANKVELDWISARLTQAGFRFPSAGTRTCTIQPWTSSQSTMPAEQHHAFSIPQHVIFSSPRRPVQGSSSLLTGTVDKPSPRTAFVEGIQMALQQHGDTNDADSLASFLDQFTALFRSSFPHDTYITNDNLRPIAIHVWREYIDEYGRNGRHSLFVKSAAIRSSVRVADPPPSHPPPHPSALPSFSNFTIGKAPTNSYPPTQDIYFTHINGGGAGGGNNNAPSFASYTSTSDTPIVHTDDDDIASGHDQHFSSIEEGIDQMLFAEDPYAQEDRDERMGPAEFLLAICPQKSLVEIKTVLHAHHYDMDSALESLFAENASVVSNLQETVVARDTLAFSAKKATVCRHFMQGYCFRSDCRYSHDSSSRICKFWTQGYCAKGDECPFVHGTETVLDQVTSSRVQRSVTLAPPPTQPVPSFAEEFPTLSASSVKKSSSIKTPSISSNPSNSTPAYSLDFWTQPVSYNEAAAKKPPVSQMINTPQDIKNIANFGSSRAKTSTRLQADWVTTGETLASIYARHRGDACELAEQRKALFQRATEAYLSGNKGAAKAFSMQAKQLNDQLSSLHTQASSDIFQTRNPSLYTAQPNNVVDLHGLHADEAVHWCSQALDILSRCGRFSSAYIITGTGHHSRSGKAQVSPAIHAFLSRNGYRVEQGKMPDGRGGILIVHI